MAPEVARVEEERRKEKEVRETAEVWQRGQVVVSKKVETVTGAPTSVDSDLPEQLVKVTTVAAVEVSALPPPPGFEDRVADRPEDEPEVQGVEATAPTDPAAKPNWFLTDDGFEKPKKKKKNRK
ncbi:unnamed protein product, partial [Mesorhabditis spiculigera]